MAEKRLLFVGKIELPFWVVCGERDLWQAVRGITVVFYDISLVFCSIFW